MKPPTAMDAIKKKMEKLSNETSEAEVRLNPCWGNVSFFITLPTLRTCFSVSFFQIRIAHFEDIKAANELEAEKYEEQLRNIQKKMQAMESAFDVCTEDLFNQTVKLEEMEKKAGNAEGEVSSLR